MSLINFFRPKWQHNKPEVRAKEIKSFAPENQNIFAKVAINDESPQVRLIAVEKLIEQKALEDVVAIEKNAEVLKLAESKLNNIYIKKIKSTEDTQEAEDLLSKINQKSHFEDLVKSANMSEIRALCVSKITKEPLLAEVATHDTCALVAQKAVEKVTRIDLQEKIYSQAKVPAVRELLKTKIQARRKLKEKELAKKQSSQKINLLHQSLLRFKENRQIITEKDQFFLYQEEWKHLEIEAGSEENELITGVITEINNIFSTNEKEKQALEQKNISFEANAAVAFKFLKEFEALTSDSSEQEIQNKENQWLSLQETLDIDQETITKITTKINQAKILLQAQNQENESISLEESEKFAALESLKSQAQTLVEQDDFAGLGKKIKALKDQCKSLKVQNADSFWSLIKKAEDRLGIHRAEVKVIFDQKCEKLEALIAEAETLNPEGDYDTTSEKIKVISHQWHEIVGDQKSNFQKLWNKFKIATSPFQEMQKWEQWHNEQEKEHIVAEAKELLTKEMNQAEKFKELRSIQKKWKHAGNISPNRHHELLESFKSFCDQIMEQCQEFFDSQQKVREENYVLKTNIVNDLQSNSEDVQNWNEATLVIQELQEKWKTIGPVPKEHNDSIWQNYREACDSFYEKRRGFLKVEEGNRETNLTEKANLCIQAEKLLNSTDWNNTTQTLKDLQNAWKTIGPVPKIESETIWKRFRLACDGFFENKRKYFEKQDEEKQSNLVKKTDLCEKLEAINQIDVSEENKVTVADLKVAWKTLGAVPRQNSDSIWERFCLAGDVYLEKEAEQDPILKEELENRRHRKESIIIEAREIKESTKWKETFQKLKDLQNEWKELGRIGVDDSILWKEFREICDEFFDRRRDQFEIMEQNRLNNLDEKLLLVAQVQKLVHKEDKDEARREVRMLRDSWKEIGGVPKKDSDRIWNEFNEACDKIFQKEEASS